MKMKSQKIRFTDNQAKFMNEYKGYTGRSIQSFVSDAIDERIVFIKLNQYLEDRPLLPDSQTLNEK